MKKARGRQTGNALLRDHYQEVTDRVIAALEKGRKPWENPWDKELAAMTAPFNAVTGKRYRGINTVVMSLDERVWSTGDPRWCSYRQAAEKGWQVRKGQKATTVFFYRKVTKKGESENDEDSTFFVLKSYPVFHASQIDGISAYEPPSVADAPWRTPDSALLILENSGAEIRTGGDRAYYSLTHDHIQMPHLSTFRSPEAWAATVLHELGHWTGHQSRLDRNLAGKGDRISYAREELRAELASVFICSELGIPSHLENHASYLGSWLQALQGDKKEIFRASADAQRIADYCLNFHPDYVKETAPEEANEAAPDAEIPAPGMSAAA